MSTISAFMLTGKSMLPDTLYKFTNAQTARLVLESLKLRWSSPSKFNDSSEFLKRADFIPSLESISPQYIDVIISFAKEKGALDLSQYSQETQFLIEIANQIILSGMPDHELKEGLIQAILTSKKTPVAEILDECINNSGIYSHARVLSLTSNSNHPLMWGHYADGERGCVFGFRHLIDKDTAFLAAKPVEYIDGPPSLGSGLDFLLYGSGDELLARTLDTICYTKSLSWAYEEEWRMVTWEKDGEYQANGFLDIKLLPEEFDTLILGAKMDDETAHNLTFIAKVRCPFIKVFRRRLRNSGQIETEEAV